MVVYVFGLSDHDYFYNPRKQSLGGYIGIALSVHLFTSCPGHNFVTTCPIWIIFHTNVVNDPGVCHDLDPKSRSQCSHTQNPCPGHNSSLPSWSWIIFHTIVVHDPRVCHDLDSKSYLKGQVHSAHIPKIRVRVITTHCQAGWLVGCFEDLRRFSDLSAISRLSSRR